MSYHYSPTLPPYTQQSQFTSALHQSQQPAARYTSEPSYVQYGATSGLSQGGRPGLAQPSQFSSGLHTSQQPAGGARYTTEPSYVQYGVRDTSGVREGGRIDPYASVGGVGGHYTTVSTGASGLHSASAIRREVPTTTQVPRTTSATHSGIRPAGQQTTLPAHYTTSTRVTTTELPSSAGIRTSATTQQQAQPIRRVYETRPGTSVGAGSTPTQYVRTTTTPGAHGVQGQSASHVRPATTLAASHYTTASGTTRPLTRVTPLGEHTTTTTATVPRVPQPVVPPTTIKAAPKVEDEDDVVEISTVGAAAAGPARTKIDASGNAVVDEDVIDADRDKIFDELFNTIEKFEEEAEQRIDNFVNRLMLPPTPQQQEAVESELKRDLTSRTKPSMDKIWLEFARKEGKQGFINFEEFTELVRNFVTSSRRHGPGAGDMEVPQMPGGMGQIMQMMASMAMGMMQKTSDVLHDKMLENYQSIATELYRRLLVKERGNVDVKTLKSQKLGKRAFDSDFMEQWGEVVEQGMKQMEATGALGDLEDIMGPQVIAVAMPIEALFGGGGNNPLMLMGGPMGMDEDSLGGFAQVLSGLGGAQVLGGGAQYSSGHPYGSQQGGYTTQPAGYQTQGVYGGQGYQTRAAPQSQYAQPQYTQPQYASAGVRGGAGGYSQGGYTTAGSYAGGAPSYGGAGGYSTRQYY